MGVLPVGTSELRTGVLSQLKKTGKTKQKWEVLPVGAKVPFPIKKHETERKKRKNPLLVRESL